MLFVGGLIIEGASLAVLGGKSAGENYEGKV